MLFLLELVVSGCELTSLVSVPILDSEQLLFRPVRARVEAPSPLANQLNLLGRQIEAQQDRW